MRTTRRRKGSTNEINPFRNRNYLSQDDVCLFGLFLLTSIGEAIRVDPDRQSPGLKHVTVIEEAHQIVGRTGPAKASESIADPRAFAAEYVCRMLAEWRGLKEGVIIIDQQPSAGATAVVGCTVTKVCLRLNRVEDREDMAASMLMTETEGEELARLVTGRAFLFTEGYDRARQIKTVNLHETMKLPQPPMRERIVPYLREDSWFKQAALRRAGEELNFIKKQMDQFERRRIDLLNALMKLIRAYPSFWLDRTIRTPGRAWQ